MRYAVSLVLSVLCAVLLLACAGPQVAPEVSFEAEPELVSASSNTSGPSQRPPMLLACGYSELLSDDTRLIAYDEDPAKAISLYDFHQEDLLNAWIAKHPTGRGFAARTTPDGKEIGKQISDVCFGNGDLAKGVIEHILIHEAPGDDAQSAMLALLQKGMTTHFLIEPSGAIYQTLDPVHAAQRDGYDKALLNADILVGIVLPDRAKVKCEVNGAPVEGGEPTESQYKALAEVVHGLRRAYPKVGETWPADASGVMLKAHTGSNHGIALDYHVNKGESQPACLDLARVLSTAPRVSP